MIETEDSDEKTVNEVLDKIRNNYKTLDEGEFNYELIFLQNLFENLHYFD